MINVMVDIDDTIIPFVQEILKRYNWLYKDSVRLEDVTDYNIHKVLNPKCKNVFEECVDDTLFDSMTISKGDINALTALNNSPYINLFFATAGHPRTMQARDKMLSRNLPWYKSSQLIMCRDKSLLKTDVLFDDCPKNFSSNRHTEFLQYIIDKPWNKGLKLRNAVRINSLSDILPDNREVKAL